MKLFMYLSKLFIGHVSIHLGCCYIFVSEKLLDRAQICTISEEGSSKRMPYGMSRNWFHNSRFLSSIAHHFCHEKSIKTDIIRAGIDREVFSMFQKKRREVVFPFFQIGANCIASPFCEIHHADFATFTKNSKFHRVEIYIFYIQRCELGDAQSSTKNSQNNSSVAQINYIVISDGCYD